MSKIGYVKKLSANKYFLRLSLGFDEFGKRMQPSRVVEAKSDREAEKKLMAFYNECSKTMQVAISKTPQTLKQLYDEWTKNHVEASLRESTAEYYKTQWEKYVEPYGKAKIKTFSPKMVNEIINKIKKDSRVRKGVYGMLKAMFNYAKRQPQPYMTINPCDYVDVPNYKAPEKEIYTQEELTYIIRIISSEKLAYQAIFYFAVICGMRRGEIIGLKWDDINFKDMYFDIRRSVTSKKGKGTVPGQTKNFTSMRRLDLPDLLIPILKGIRAEQTEQILKLGNRWIDEGWVFTRFYGQVMSESSPDHWLARLKKQYPVWPKKDLHTLRHTAITDMIVSGAPISTVSEAAGHAQQSTTLNIYSHVIQSTKKRVIEHQNKIISDIKANAALSDKNQTVQ